MKFLKTLFRLPELKFNWWKEVLFAIPVALLVYFYLWDDKAIMSGIMVAFTISILGIWWAHIIRKIMIPEFSITLLYKKSLENALASAITLLAVFYLLSVIIQALKLQ